VIGSQMHEPCNSSALSACQSSRQVQVPTKQSRPRVVSCDFEMQIPRNALRIDMTILVLTNDKSCCESGNNNARPSVSYKITICTPRRQGEHQVQKTTPTTTTTTTFNWSSKFIVAKDLDETIDPFHEWNGSFVLGEKKKTCLCLDDCSFFQVQGTFLSQYDTGEEDNTNTNTNFSSCETTNTMESSSEASSSASTSTSTSTSTAFSPKQEEDLTSQQLQKLSTRKQKKTFNDIDNNNDDFLVPPRKKQRYPYNLNSVSKEGQQ